MFIRVLSLAVLVVALLVPTPGVSAPYPEKPIQLIVHGKAGAGMDMFCRALAKSLEGILAKPVVVENRPGGGSAVATTYVATHKDPGYAWLAVTNTHVITPLTSKTPFSLKDLKPVAMLVADPTVLVTSAKSPWKTFDELIAQTKAAPGSISCAIAFIGSLDHALLLQLKKLGYDFKPLPFESGSEAVVSIVGGHTDIGFSEPSEVESQVRAGTLRVLATFSGQRLASMPEVPTIFELGYPIEEIKFRGIMVNKDTPADVVAAIDKALQQALKSPVLSKYIEQSNMLVDYKGPDDFAKSLDKTISSTSDFLDGIGKLKK